MGSAAAQRGAVHPWRDDQRALRPACSGGIGGWGAAGLAQGLDLAAPAQPTPRACPLPASAGALQESADRAKGNDMAIGPVQLIVLGFNHPNFHGEIIDELERLRESDTVRVIDAPPVHKDARGEIEVAHLSNLTLDEAVELGSKVGALIGLGIEGEEGMVAGAEGGAEAAADGVQGFRGEAAAHGV